MGLVSMTSDFHTRDNFLVKVKGGGGVRHDRCA